MKKVWIVIALTTLYAIAFNLAPHFGASLRLMIAGFILSPFLVLYMVWVILKYGTPSKYTFDQKFYDDHSYRRNGTEELQP